MTTENKARTGREPVTVDEKTGEIIEADNLALPSAATYGEAYRVSDLIPSPAKWRQYEAIPLDDLIGRDLVLRDVMFFDSLEREGDEWAIILFDIPGTDGQLTTATGSRVVLRKLHHLDDYARDGARVGLFPCVARFTKTPSKVKGNSDYYDVI